MGISAQQHRIVTGSFSQNRYMYGRYGVSQLNFNIYANFDLFLHFIYYIASRDDISNHNINNRVLGGRKVSYYHNIYLILFQYIITCLLVMTLWIHAQNCYSDIFCHDSKHMLHPSINMLFNPTSAFISGNHRIFINLFFFATIIKNVDSSHCKKVIIIFELLKGKLKVKSSLIENYSFKYLYWVTMLNIFLIVILDPKQNFVAIRVIIMLLI